MLRAVTDATEGVYNKLTGQNRIYRVDVRVGTGQREIFTLKACTRDEAAHEAEKLALAMSEAKGKAVLYCLAGGTWTVAGSSVQKVGMRKRMKDLLDKFFYVDTEEEI